MVACSNQTEAGGANLMRLAPGRQPLSLLGLAIERLANIIGDELEAGLSPSSVAIAD